MSTDLKICRDLKFKQLCLLQLSKTKTTSEIKAEKESLRCLGEKMKEELYIRKGNMKESTKRIAQN